MRDLKQQEGAGFVRELLEASCVEIPFTLLLSGYDSEAMTTVSVILDILARTNPTTVNILPCAPTLS